MAGNIISAPVEASRIATKTLALGGRFARTVGGGALHQLQPNYLPPEVVRDQRELRREDFQFGVMEYFDLSSMPDDLADAKLRDEADMLEAGGMATEGSVVEIRPFMSEEDMWDYKLIYGIQAAVVALQAEMGRRTDATAVFNAHPIMPGTAEHPSIAATETWRGITRELSGLDHQFGESQPQHIGIVALGNRHTIAEAFGTQFIDPKHLEVGGLMTLHEVADRPADNIIYPVARP